ncbi:outer membrane protein [Phenylobacterium sp.]|uniref:outer membrane protein n=1 Tax=Phenylobacterium sp. TaxID=1871053 RepID=UPI002730922F|nr:outer membrane beta-barrel protein [Phenylobacterium sp.]MDP1875645.1 outer membrane beta-barrel protein [Phenylobacterium sp.]MDP3491329.1 outer membrane beta-barrel protein [Phenylobacterium sp.]
MKTMLCAAAAIGALTAASAAQAQSASDWTGPYVGGVVGYGWQAENDDDNETVVFDTNLDGTYGDTVRTGTGANAFSPGFCSGGTYQPTPASACGGNDDGPEFGVRAGYDWQFGNIVAGVLGEAVRTDVKNSVTAFSTTPASYTMSRELDGLLAARVRVGYAVGNSLPYITGGYAGGAMQRHFSTTNTANTFTETSDSNEWVDGWQLGGGVEHKITSDLSLGLEYLYTRLEDEGYTVRASGGPAGGPFTSVNGAGTDFQRTNDEFNVHSVRMAATYRF